MGDYNGYLQGLSLAAILILAPIAFQSLLTDDTEVVFVFVPGDNETTTVYIENNTTSDDARNTELDRSEVARIATFNIKVFGETKMSKPAIIDVLVDTVLQYDLVAVQEIKDIDQTVPHDFLDALNNKSFSPWDMVLKSSMLFTTILRFSVQWGMELCTMIALMIHSKENHSSPNLNYLTRMEQVLVLI